VTVRIRNSGNTVAAYSVTVVGRACEWAEPPAEPVRLFPDETGKATVTFTIPKRGSPPAGKVAVGIRVADVTTPAVGTVEEFDLEISPEVFVLAKLSPVDSSGWRKGRHRIELSNEGNVEATAHVEATDPTGQLRCRVAPEALIPAGTTINLKLIVAAPHGRLFGRQVAHPFSSLVERQHIQQVGDRLGVPGAWLVCIEPHHRSTAPALGTGDIATPVENRPIQVGARVVEMIPTPKNRHERLMHSVVCQVGGTGQQRGSAHLPNQLRAIEVGE
jgi:hypothetical protein